MYAYQILARIRSGLQLCGKDGFGDLEWIGTTQQWDLVDKEEMAILWK